jgi:hypothetical protein
MVRPLTKRDPDGVLYARPSTIETAITVATQQDLDCLGRRAWVSDHFNSEFLPMECLVHLIREALRRSDDPAINVLMPPLLARGEQMLKTKIRDNGLSNASKIRENILSDFSLLFIEDGRDGHVGELDFFECRFNSAFSCFRIDYLRREKTRSKRLEQFPTNDDPRLDSDGQPVKSSESIWGIPAAQVQTVFRKERLEAIDKLPFDERKVVILCGVLGVKEESDDPTVVTAATLCGVTGRTIRNRLKRAAAKLLNFKGDV